MEYAITARQVGHDVTIVEKGDALGGAMAWAGNYSTLPNMEQIAYQPDWHKLMVAKLGIPVRLNTALTADIVASEKPDVVVVATVSYAPDPADPSKKYVGTHFDMFRLEHGKIAEHWDSVPKDPAALHTDPNVENRP